MRARGWWSTRRTLKAETEGPPLGGRPRPLPVPTEIPARPQPPGDLRASRPAAAPRSPRNREERGLDPHDDGSSVPPAGVCEAAQVPASPGNTVPAHGPGAGEACALALTFLFWTHPPEVAERAVKTCSSFPPHHLSPIAGTAWGMRGTEEKDIFRGKLRRYQPQTHSERHQERTAPSSGKGKTPISLSGDLG